MVEAHFQKQSYTSSANVPWVSAVVGEGADAHREIVVSGWSLTAWTSDEEPRVADEDLCVRFEYARIGKLRERIRQLREQDPVNFSPKEVFPEPGKTGGRPGSRFFLNESEALFLATQIETPAARAMTHEMIRVYMAARRDLLPQQQGLAEGEVVKLVVRVVGEQTAALLAALPEMIGRVVDERLARHDAADTGCIGEAKAEQNIKSRLREIARLRLGVDATQRAVNASRARTDHELRTHVDYPMGRAWKYLPNERLARVVPRLDDMLRTAQQIDQARREERERARQLGLFELQQQLVPARKPS